LGRSNIIHIGAMSVTTRNYPIVKVKLILSCLFYWLVA
jgi:hypothetical protein